MTKQQRLDAIARVISGCRECKAEKSGLPVPGEGNPDADIVFLGEAPGRTEAATGRPFVGRSGKLLRRMIGESGLRDTDVYITSPVKFLPDRGTPTKAHIRHGRMHLAKQLTVIEPKIIVLLGATAVYAMLEKTLPIMKVHGSVLEQDGRAYLITLHPAAVLRFPKYAPLMQHDFSLLQRMTR